VKLESPPPGPPFAPTAPNLFRYARETHGAREFLVLDDERVSFAEADRRSVELAKGLLALGLGKGARVGILMPNCPDWVIAFMACARVGAHAVLLSTFYQAPEIAWGVRHNDVQVLLAAARYLRNDYVERLEAGLPGLAEAASAELHLPEQPHLRHIAVWGECDRRWALPGPEGLLAAAAARPQVDDALLAAVEARVSPADPLLTICTSGTTAEPKAVVHCHGVAVRAPFQFLDFIDVRPDERSYVAMPFFWIGGINVNLIPTLFMGACMYFTRTPDAAEVLALCKREQITRIIAWPAQLQRMRELLDEAGETLPTLRIGLYPPKDKLGRPIPPERRAGGQMGMTESFGMHSSDPIDIVLPLGKAGSWGRKLPGMERVVVDPETGEPLPRGEKGELLLRGYNMMLGYYGKERWETFTRDGFFRTGDLVVLDEDEHLFFLGRMGEMIKTAGANVAPAEVEKALMGCEGVREAVVFGLPDPVKGEVVAAVVAPSEGSELTLERLRAQLAQALSAYKTPQAIAFLSQDEFPRTGSGKPIKRKLKEMLFP
jgi:acyl-CoA synthetase (AMP-forming)/AMP-acid ligase II